MRLLVKVRNQNSVIVGYCPNEKGNPQAICVIDGRLEAVPLCDVELQRLPKALRAKHRRRQQVEEYVAS